MAALPLRATGRAQHDAIDRRTHRLFRRAFGAIVADGWRQRMIGKIVECPWKGLYAVIAAVGLALIIWGYALARQTPVVLYVPPQWMRYVALILMVPVFPLLLSTYLPGRIQAATRHPMLAATKLWAFAHLLVNGTLADVLLFGAFLAWAVADRISLKYRAEPWVPRLPRSAANDAISMVGGLGIYVAFTLWLHTLLIGVSPLG
jgi:uncharacterized membrane protein